MLVVSRDIPKPLMRYLNYNLESDIYYCTLRIYMMTGIRFREIVFLFKEKLEKTAEIPNI